MARAAVLVAWLAVLVAGCQGPAARGEPVVIDHVHGLAFVDGRLFVATHRGLVAGVPDDGAWSWAYAGDERYDYMGFSADGEGTLFSSGHPDDPRAYGATSLGLRRSVDQGRTWEQRSLKGEADFHGLAADPAEPGVLVGAWRLTLMVSSDGGLAWANHTAPAMPSDVAMSNDHVFITTAAGLLRADHALADWTLMAAPDAARPATSIDLARDGSLAFAGTGNGRSGTTFRSTDGGVTWTPVDHPDLGQPAVPIQFAFDADDTDHVFAATVGGTILESHNAGVTWSTVRS